MGHQHVYDGHKMAPGFHAVDDGQPILAHVDTCVKRDVGARLQAATWAHRLALR